jgi:hypothetical protein
MQNHGQRTAFYSCRSVPPQFILAALSVKFNYVVQRPGGRRLARAPISDPYPMSVLEFKSRGALPTGYNSSMSTSMSIAVDPLAFPRKFETNLKFAQRKADRNPGRQSQLIQPRGSLNPSDSALLSQFRALESLDAWSMQYACAVPTDRIVL